MPGERRDVLNRRADYERTRVEAAQRHLRILATIGRLHGWPIVVLKGASAALNEEYAVDMEDVDVLVHPDGLEALQRELRRVGYRRAGTGGSARHVEAVANDDLLAIEVHFTLDLGGTRLDRRVWDGIRPMPNVEGLWILDPADHLWLMLEHIVEEHPNRRSNVRELLLLASLLGAVPAVASDIERRIDTHPSRPEFDAVLGAACALHRGRSGSSVLDREAVATLAVRRLLRRHRLPQLLVNWSYQIAFAALLGKAARGGFWRRLIARRGRSRYRWLGMVEHVHPALGMTVRLLGRGVGVLASMPIALPVAALAIMVRRQALKGP
jgi:hypothetical protein